MLFGVGVLCRILSVVYYLDVSFSRLITLVGEERTGFSIIDFS